MTGISVRERSSPNHAPRDDPPRIDMLVLHYTGMRSAGEALDRLCDPAARVSAHYVIEEDGTVWRLVPEARRGFHAGISCWEREGDLNHVSIGVEIVNPGHDWGYRPFPEDADAGGGRVVPRHSLTSPDSRAPHCRAFRYRTGAQERPGRAVRLAAARARRASGCGLNQAAERQRLRSIGRARWTDLSNIGYCVAANAEAPVVAAFQRRFRPARVDGIIDDETAFRLAEVQDELTRVPVESDVKKPGLIEAGRSPLHLATHDLAGMVMRQAPGAVFADKKVACGERAAVEFFLAQDECGIAE